jgi:hypothetical protein
LLLTETADRKMMAAVPAGTSSVVLQYTEPGFWFGLFVAVLFFAGCFVFSRYARFDLRFERSPRREV